MDLNNILSQLGSSSKDIVHLSITPGVGLELIQLDVSGHTVKNYAYRPLEYNESLREIADIEAFKDAVQELFAELKVNPKSSVVLNLPMVLFGVKELPLLLADEAISEALVSEVEQSYIFKRYEPSVSWVDPGQSQSGEMRKLFYSAIQKNVIEDISAALTEIGASLVGVDISLTSILKAMSYTGLAEEQMKDNVSWNLMIINPNGYSICSLVGKHIIDYYEEPLAIKSFEGDEIYNAISASAQISLMSYPANYLYIVSETDMVSAELLSKRMPVDCTVNYWDNNSYKKQDALPVSLEVIEETAHKISLEAIGSAVGSAVTMPTTFNFLSTSASIAAAFNPDEPVHVSIGGSEFDISPNAARNLSMLIALLILIPVFIIFLVVPRIAKQKQEQLDDINSRLQATEASIKKLENEQNKANDFDINAEIKKVMSNNRSKLMAYTALGESVPKNLWVTYFVAKDDGKIDIKGISGNVEEIYVFYKNMKDSLINTKLRLHQMNMRTDSVDDAVSVDPNAPMDYDFEVTNMSASELHPHVAPAPAAEASGVEEKESDNRPGAFNKPLLNFGKGNK